MIQRRTGIGKTGYKEERKKERNDTKEIGNR